MFTFSFYLALIVLSRVGPTLISGATESNFVSYDCNHRLNSFAFFKLHPIKTFNRFFFQNNKSIL